MTRKAGSVGTETEKAVRSAAIRLIAKHSYEAVTLRQIAEAVDLQPGSIYRYFPSKQMLLRSIMTEHMKTLLKDWRLVRPVEQSPSEQLEAFISFHVQEHTTRRDEVFIGNMELRSLEPKYYREVVSLRDEYEMELRDILKCGAGTGEFKIEDLGVTSRGILAMLTGVCTWYREGGSLSKRRLAQIYQQLVTTGIAAATHGAAASETSTESGKPARRRRRAAA